MMMNAIAYCTFLAFPIAGFILQGNSPGHEQGPAGNVFILNCSRFFCCCGGVLFQNKKETKLAASKSVQFEPSSDLQPNNLDFGEVQAEIFIIKTDAII